MSGVEERNITEFNRDVIARDGYVYTTGDKLSCRLSNRRTTEAILELVQLDGKRVIDVGCGDGTYSVELLEAGAREVIGIDAARLAIESARRRFGERENLRFEVADVYALEEPVDRYDIAVVRGLLHHLYQVEKAVECICRVADRVIVVEPNGYNLALKLIEKLSPYHVRHEERSYRPRQVASWFERFGGSVERSIYVGLVPFFCPDLIARILKWAEPLVERIPLLCRMGCGQCVQRILTGPRRRERA